MQETMRRNQIEEQRTLNKVRNRTRTFRRYFLISPRNQSSANQLKSRVSQSAITETPNYKLPEIR